MVLPFLITVLVILAFAIGVLYTKVQYLESKPSSPSAPSAAQAQPQLPAPSLTAAQLQELSTGGFSKGNPNAKVAFIEFADYQCPFCERFFSQVEPQLFKDYVDSGKARFIYHDFAFLDQGTQTKESHWASEAARCAADQNKFWDYHDYLFSHQGQENSGAFSKENLKKFAAAVGLNQSQFNNCLDSDKYLSAVDQDTQLGQTVGVSGTPTTFVNAKMMAVNSGGSWQSVGAAPYNFFQNEIDQALK